MKTPIVVLTLAVLSLRRTWFLAMTVVSGLPGAAYALEGTATYTPAESNLAIKYWVKGSTRSGDAAAALDGKPDTRWTPAQGQAELLVDLGGTYDAVHKVRLHFADNDRIYLYRLQGSVDAQTWRPLADRSSHAARGRIFTVGGWPPARHESKNPGGPPMIHQHTTKWPIAFLTHSECHSQ